MAAGNFKVTLAEPLTETASPVLVPVSSEILIFLAVPQLVVVILFVPSKEVPFIVLDVTNLVEYIENKKEAAL